MALTEKQKLQKKAKGLGVEFTTKTTIPQLQKLIAKAEEAKDAPAEEDADDSDESQEDSEDEEHGSDSDDEDDEEGERLAPAPQSNYVPEQQDTGDYLRKYQFKKDLPLGDPRTDPVKGSKAYAMKQHLLKQDKVRMLVASGNDGFAKTVPFSVTLNGYRLDFPKRTYLDVPEQIARIIMKNQKQTDAALETMRLDREETKDGVSIDQAF